MEGRRNRKKKERHLREDYFNWRILKNPKATLIMCYLILVKIIF